MECATKSFVEVLRFPAENGSMAMEDLAIELDLDIREERIVV